MTGRIRLTRRGKAVAALAAVTLAFLAHDLTKDVCWTGNGYGSCEELWFGKESK